MAPTSMESLLSQLQTMLADTEAIVGSIFFVDGITVVTARALAAHLAHAEYALRFAAVVLNTSIETAAKAKAAAELEQVNGRA